jgi:hypothetical protein
VAPTAGPARVRAYLIGILWIASDPKPQTLGFTLALPIFAAFVPKDSTDFEGLEFGFRDVEESGRLFRHGPLPVRLRRRFPVYRPPMDHHHLAREWPQSVNAILVSTMSIDFL